MAPKRKRDSQGRGDQPISLLKTLASSPPQIDFKPSNLAGTHVAACSDAHLDLQNPRKDVRVGRISFWTWKSTENGSISDVKVCSELDIKGNITCSKWSKYPLTNSVLRSQRKTAAAPENSEGRGFFFVTTTEKRIYVIDHLSGEIVSETELESTPIDLCSALPSKDGKFSLWVSAKHHGGLLSELEIPSGKSLKTLKIHGLPEKIISYIESNAKTKKYLLCAGVLGKMRLYDGSNGKMLKTLNGHATKVTHMEFSNNGSYIISSAEDDENICVWDTRIETTANALLILSAGIVPLKFFLNTQEKTSPSQFHVTVAAIGIDGVIHVWNEKDANFIAGGECKTCSPPRIIPSEFTISLVDDKHKSISKVHSAYFSSEGLTTVRGVPHSLVFDQVLFSERLRDSISVSCAPIFNSKPISRLMEYKREEKDDSKLLADSVTSIVPKDYRDIKKLEDSVGASLPGKLTNGYSTQPTGVIESQCNGISTKFTDHISFAHGIMQAIMKEDEELTLKFMNMVNKKAIPATVVKLETRAVFPLLKILLSRIRVKPSQYITCIRWLRELLFHHASYIISLPKIENELGQFCKIMESRVSLIDKLLNLSARLDIIVMGIEKKLSSEQDSGKKPPIREALVSIDETETDEISDEVNNESDMGEFENSESEP